MAYGKYNNNTVSYSVKDSKHLAAVSVSVTFNPAGEMRPDFVQVVKQDESKETYKIQGIKSHDKVTAYIQYICLINSYGYTKEIKLMYFILDHIWFIEK